MTSDFIKQNGHDKQREFIGRFISEILLEQKSYLLEQPEIELMIKRNIAKITCLRRIPIDVLKHAALYFTRPAATLQDEIKKLLKIPTDTPRVFSNKLDKTFDYENENIDEAKETITHTDNSTSDTNTSSFTSIVTSASTLMTPDFDQDLEQTTLEQIRDEVVYIVNIAVLSKVTDEDIQYDIAYVEVMYAVEDAMEIPILEIRKDVIELLRMSYYVFESQIAEKERIAAQNAAKNKMKKKLMKLMRHRQNFKGLEAPQVAGGEISPHETLAMKSDKYQVQCRFNRYPKDRFGIYLPRTEVYEFTSITMSPEVSLLQLVESEND